MGALGPVSDVTVAMRPVAVVSPVVPARGSVVSFWLIEAVVLLGPLMPLQPMVGAVES